MSMNREPRRGRGEGRGGQGSGGTQRGARGEARGGARGGARGWQNQRGNGGRLPEGNEREDQQIRNIRNNRGRGDRRRQRDYNGQQHGQNVERIIHPIGYKRLEELTTLEPHETLHRLAAYKKGLEALLKESEIRFDLMIQLTTALANACSCKTAQTTLQDIVLTLQCENFLTTHLTKYIREMHHSIAMKEIIPNLLSIVLCILSSMLSIMPSLFNDVGVIILCLEQSIDRCKEINVFFPDEMSIKLDRLKEYQSAVENEEYKRDNERGRNLIENASPEDDFHDLPIFPLAEELKEGHRPFLRRNIVNKGYDDVNHYLDIQFRLLKEDFVAPLRNGISEYRWHLQQKNDQKHIRLQNAYVYHKVQVLEGKSIDEGIAYLARFSTEHLLRVNWERAQRLLFGSLVCLSSDNFETLHFATVANRKTEDLQRGLIDLKFHGAIETLQTLFSKTFTMVESSAYFEAYRHVLKRIQEIREDSFPLEKYIVRVDPHLELPSYLRRNPSAIYDLKPVAQKGKMIKSLISRPRSWPPETDFDLDSSQFEAFKAALTEEICIIQGPPGTGKTFIGLKIVETLLKNREVWSPNGDINPILLICYTNHALDQFLEGILEFLHEGVVRIGGRSSSEKIKALNLKELRRTRSQQKQRAKHQYLQVKNIRGEMIRLAKEMLVAQKSVRTASSMILKENTLRDVIPHEQYRSLLTGFFADEAPNLKTGEFIAYWLGAIVGEHDTQNAYSEDEDEININIHRDLAPPLNPNTRTGVHRRQRQRQEILEGQQLQEYISRILRSMDEMEEGKYAEVNDVWNLTLLDRWRFYRCCQLKHQQNLQRSLEAAHRVILKEEVLQPFMTKDHRDSLDILTRNRNIQHGQNMALFLCALGGQWTANELTRAGSFDEIKNENDVIQMMTDYMKNDDNACRMNVTWDMMIYVAKGMAQISPMSNSKAQNVKIVGQLPVSEKWRLYKYWVSLYCAHLHECLEVSRTGILREEKIMPLMTAAQVASLQDESRNENIQNLDGGQLILLWLEAYSGVPLAVVQIVIDNLPEGDDDEIDIFGEADIANEERYLEDENDEEMNLELETLVDYDDYENDGVDITRGSNVNDNEGWAVASKNDKKLKEYVAKNLRRVDRMQFERAACVENVWELDMKQRWDLYRHWVHLHKAKVLLLQEEYEKQTKLLHEARAEEDVEIIKESHIIALTTTGASKYHHLLQRAQPRIVVVEEAAEVLEAHIVTSLTENCQHLVLIGDHQQLRPNPTVYELAKRYHLDISLFERLINNNFPKHRLNLQHRMRPEISQLLKIHEKFYPDLQDHDSVKAYDHVRGVDKDVFFLNHNVAEKVEQDGRSRSNEFEAEFLTGLCRYLLQQEYRPDQITILTAYTGQLWSFRNLMPRSVFGSVKVCPVDRYQGEENDIILLSLVRSNDIGNIGFLKIANRVCVALSRAKIGLYCVGNFTLLSEESEVWKKITDYLSMKSFLGDKMVLRCANHPTETTEVQAAKDFMAVPEGGCKKPCETRLDCGHVCPMICHPRDSAHFNIMCKKQCTKTICDLHHECSRLCYQPCDTDCNFKINKLLECGHTKEIHCHEGSSHNIQCIVKCQILLRCGHHCKKNCSEECTDVCKEKVVKQFKCGHKGKAECGNMDDNCPELCDNTLLCGHKCGGTCGACKHGRLHVPCVQPCKRTLVCGHECKSTCTEYCPPCVKHCENRCKHSKCVRKCGQSCTSCQEVCEWSCAHSECHRPCGESCVRLPCDEPCRKLLPCKHECIGVCGETCPKLCRICNKDEVTEVLFGNEDKYDARFVLLEDCDHIIEVVALDTWMEQTTVDEDTTVQLCVCPKCKTPIRRNLRYGNIIKQVRADVEEIKKQVRGDPVNIREKREELIQDLSLEGDGTVGELRRTALALTEEQRVSKCPFTCSVLRAFVNNFQSQIKQCWTETQMTSLSYKMDMFKKLCEQKRKTTRIEDRKGNLERKQTLDRIFQDILKWLDKLSYISDQNAEDWDRESKRISFCIKLMEDRLRVSVTRTPQVSDILKKVHLILTSGFRFSDDYQKFVKSQFKEMRKYGTGLGVSEEEKKTIVKAVGLSAGHWYKCSNGHFYAIGECGGAMETGKCPECQEEIGGRNHALHSSNVHSPEMDGSRHAAWSAAANMANFDPREFD